MTTRQYRQQRKEWKKLYAAIADVLAPLGREDNFGKADYWILDEDWGNRGQKVLINNLGLLRPDIVQSLQTLLRDFPEWHIALAVDIRGKELDWPDMGLTLTASGIEDELDRNYLPTEFQNYSY
jgi:hypothetical protein